MSTWEPSVGASDEWYTPRWIFLALRETFDLDVAHPEQKTHVPCLDYISENSLQKPWSGFIWMNPPFGGRNGLVPWMEKFFDHGDGIALTPDRTSAPWWQDAAQVCDSMYLFRGKVKFERPDGSIGGSPGSGVTLWAAGGRATRALGRLGNTLGTHFVRK